jgi:hypothetical protein
VIPTAAALVAQTGSLGDWLMPAGVAIGAATALFIRARRAKRGGKPSRHATTR